MRLHPRESLKLICLAICFTLLVPLPLPFAVGAAPPVSSVPRKVAITPTSKGRPATGVKGQEAGSRVGELLVRFRWEVQEQEAASLAASLGMASKGRLRGASGVEKFGLTDGTVAESVLANLRMSELVAFAEPNYAIVADQVAPDDPLFTAQWALRGAGDGAARAEAVGVNAAPAWQHTTGSPGTVVALIDSGVDFSHPDLDANRWSNGGETAGGLDEDGNGYTDDLHGWDWVENSGTGRDEHGHGTAVAGIIAAEGNNREGVAGVMWRAGLMSLRVLDKEGRGRVADAVEAIDYAVAHGAHVINLSWGLDEPSVALRQAVERALAGNVTVVCAAGNGGRDVNAAPRFPAGYNHPALISVAATTRGEELAGWSNRGPGRVTLAAPGEAVLTTKAGGGYEAVSGTSASAALVSGVAGLLRTLRPRLSAARTRELIERGARRVAALSDKVRGGVLDAEAALGNLSVLHENEGVADDGEGNEEGDGREDTARPVRPVAPGPFDLGIDAVPPPREVEAPNLPNLEELRRQRPDEPRAIPPVPSTRRRCPPHNPRCNEDDPNQPPPTPTPAPDASAQSAGGPSLLARLVKPSLLAVAEAVLHGGRPSVTLPLLDYYASDAYSTTDAPAGSLPAAVRAEYLSAPTPLFQGSPARLNVAAAINGGAAVASSTATGNYPATAVTDGDREGTNYGSGGGWRDATSGAYPDWIEVAFAGHKSIDEVNVFTLQDAYTAPSEPTETMTFTLYGITSFNVQYWTGSAWANVPGGVVTGNNKVWRKFTFAPVTTNKIRVLVNASQDAWTRIVEVEAYGTPAFASPQSFVTSKTTGTLRNNYTGHVGMKVTTGALPVTVTSLGRLCAAGNSASHTLKAVRASDNAVVASASVTMSGCVAGQFRYGALASPVTLPANTTYYFVSTETSGGDKWHDYLNTVLTTTSAASVNHGIHGDGVTWGPAGGAGNCYVPVDFQYTAGTTSGTGLKGQYYDNLDYTVHKLTRNDATVNFNWDLAAPAGGVGAEEFSVRWSGMIVPLYSETYTFYTTSDDGVRLWVNGQLLIDKWIDQGATEWSGQIALVAGRSYDIRLDFYERWHGAVAKLSWSSPSQPKQIIPASQLYNCFKPIDQFVRDFYLGGLGRQPSASELQTWTGRLSSALDYQSLVAEAQALGVQIFASQEYVNRARTDREYVYDLYWAYLQRGPDQGGWDYWTQGVAANGRAAVRNAFAASGEFQEKVRRLCGATASDPATGGAGHNFEAALLDPQNRTGGAGVDPYSRNFNWSLPLLSLPGRAGLDLSLTLGYNSLVWTKDNAGITFDADRGFPGPGFRLGFPTVLPKFYNPQIQQAGQPTRYSYLLVTPAGRRAELRQVGATNVYEAADSSNYQLTEVGGALELRTDDGTRLSFAPRDGQFRCHEVKDRQGNYITINYDAYGQVSNVVDTLGRVVTFNYDAFQNLISITQPWKRETETGSVQETHTWATFGYANLTLQPSFSNLAVVGAQPGMVIPVLSQVGLDDGSYYKFKYNGWGQVWKVTHFAADSVGANGVPEDDHPLSYTWLDLPGAEASGGGGVAEPATPQSDCPRFTERRVWVENGVMNQSAEVKTAYSAWSPSLASCDTTFPDGTLYRDIYGSGWETGLTTQSEVWSGGQRKKWTTFELAHDGPADAQTPTNPRVSETNVYDAEGNRRRTAVTFTSYGLPQQVVEYKADAAAPLRTTATDYNLSAEYTSRRIIGLPSAVRVYEGAAVAANLRAKVSHVYDDNTLTGYLQGLPAAATQHDAAGYGTAFRWRGNLSRLRRHEVNQQTGAETGALTEIQSGYFITGSVALARDASGHQSSVSYADAFFDNVNRNTFAYPTVVTDPDGFTSSTWYNYDMGVVAKTRGPKPNETTNLPGPVRRLIYDAAGRTRKDINGANNAHTELVYAATNTSVQTFQTVEDASLTDASRRAYSTEILDGLGRVRAKSRELPGSGGGAAGQRFYFDSMGRVARTYNPTEIDAAWSAVGDDAAAGWVYTAQAYDWNGRPTVTTNQDATTRQVTYGGCGCAGGEVITTAGEVVQLPPQSGAGAWSAGRRTRRTYRDVLGRPFKVEVLNRDGTPYQTTVTAYNARDQVTSVKEYKGAATADGSCPSGTCQLTTSAYDGYGRLQSRRLPQHSAPATFAYNADDTIHQEVDPRGASGTYAYNNNRHLVSSITYAAPAPIAAPTITYTYDAVGLVKTQSDQGGTASYQYDTLGRLTSETRTFNGLAGSYTLGYTYNLADQLRTLTDPAGQTITYTYDKVGDLSAVTGSAYGGVTQYASGMKYRASGALKETDYGNGLKLTIGYDTRLRPKRYHVRLPTAPAGTGDRSLYDYEYEADGRVRSVYDRIDPGFDRSNLYDLAGRLMDSHTAGAAFYQSFAYDEFGHMIDRGNGSWRYYERTTSQYLNNRNTSTTTGPLSFPTCCPPQPVTWTYNAAGQVTRDHNKEYTYDAVGNKVRVMEVNGTFAGGGSPRLWIHQDYDANGERVKRVEQTPTGPGTYAYETTYYVRSSALGGRVVTELDQGGTKKRTYVYAGGAALAEQENNQVVWSHTDPVTGSRRKTGSDLSLGGREELDPLGNDVPLTDPAPPDDPTPDYLYPGTYNDSGNPYDGPSGCALDGQPVPCDLMMLLLRFGSGVGREGGSIRVLTDYSGRDPREFPPMMIRAIQIPGSRINTNLDLDALRNKIKEYNTERCQEFVKDLLTQAGKEGGDDAVHTDLLDLFDAVRGQKGISVGIFKDESGASVTYSTVNGAVGGAENAEVLLSAVSNYYPTPELRTHYHASNAIGELTHVAGSKPSGYDYGAFSDVHLARVAFRVAAQHGLKKKVGPPTLKPGDKGYEVAYSNYYHDILKHFCVRSPETIYQRKKTPAKGRKGKRK